MGGAGSSASTSGTSEVVMSSRRKKSVTWAPDDRLESVRFIEKAIYDDDPTDVSYKYLLDSVCTDFSLGYACITQLTGPRPWRGCSAACTSL